MPERTIVVARRFRGPDAGVATANGGYFCGLVADAAPAAATIEIRARAGVPLERPLAVRLAAGTVEVLDDGALVARSSAERLAVRLDDGSVPHAFPECFVCGHRRAPGDGMRLFAGPVPGDGPQRGQVRVAGWRPDPAFLDAAGRLRPEFVWAALDCPGGWALPGPINTGTLQVEIREPVDGRHPVIVMGWRAPAPSPRAGSRRRYAGTAIFDAGGRLLALGAAIWVAPDPLAAAR